eukprot:6204222-Prymnesium_polylepis.1
MLAAAIYNTFGFSSGRRMCLACVRGVASDVRATSPTLRALHANEATEDEWRRVLSALSPFAKEERVEKLNDMLAKRRGGLHIVLDNIADPFDTSAIMRTVEGLGVQHVHLVESERKPAMPPPRKGRRSNRSKLKAAEGNVAMGASRWLTVRKYSSAADCYTALRAMGLQVFAFCPPPIEGDGKWSLPVEVTDGPQSDAARQTLGQPVGTLPIAPQQGVALIFDEQRGEKDRFHEFADA